MVDMLELTKVFESFSPLDYQCEWDNTGWNIYHSGEVTGIFVCLDVSEHIIELAEECGCNVILSHHPLLFRPLKSISDTFETGLLTEHIIQKRMSLFCAHTAVDSAPWGINGYLADLLGIVNRSYIEPGPTGQYGLGIIGDVTFRNAFDVADLLKRELSLGSVRIAGNCMQPVRRLAICSGAAGDLCKTARDRGADVFISGEIKHNYYVENTDIVIIEAGHYGTEFCFCRIALDYLQKMPVGLKYNVNLFTDEFEKCPYTDY